MPDTLTEALEAERDQLAVQVGQLEVQLGQAETDREQALERARRADARRVRVADQADGLGRALAQAKRDRAELTRRLAEAQAERDALAARVHGLEASRPVPPADPLVSVRWLRDSTPGSCHIAGRSYVGQGSRDANPRLRQPSEAGQVTEVPVGAAVVLRDAGFVRGATPAGEELIHAAKYPPGAWIGQGHPLDPAYSADGGPRPRMPAGVQE
jgi:hypothetical protein